MTRVIILERPGKLSVTKACPLCVKNSRRNYSGAGLPGMQLVVSWSMGEDRLYTGLRPKKGKGFADFEMKPQVNYDVTLAGYHAGVAEGLRSELDAGICPTDTIALDWRLIFQRIQ